MYYYVTCKKCKYNYDGKCTFYVMGSGNEIDMPCYREKELIKEAADNFLKAFVETESEGGRMIIQKTETFIEHDIFVDDIKVGTVELCPERHEIARLEIFQPYQDKGYGTQVVTQLVEQGYTSLFVRSDNEKALHIYQKCGFVKGDIYMFNMIAHTDKEGDLNEC